MAMMKESTMSAIYGILFAMFCAACFMIGFIDSTTESERKAEQMTAQWFKDMEAGK